MIAKYSLQRYLTHVIVFLCLSCLLILVNTQAYASSLSNIQTNLIQLGYTAIPLHKAPHQNTLLVDVSFESELGKNKPVTLILDTGSATTYINQKLVKQYHFKQTDNSIISGGIAGHRYRSYQVIIPAIRLLNFTSHNEYVYSQRRSFLSTSGILGLDFLRKHYAIIDTSNQKLYLKLNIDKPTEAQSTALQKIFLTSGYKLISLERSPSGQQTVMIKINHYPPARFMLDIGVPLELMLDIHYAKKLGLPNFHSSIQIKNISIGSISWYSNKNVSVADLHYAQIGIPIFGVVGLDWMQKTHSIIDTANDWLYVKP